MSNLSTPVRTPHRLLFDWDAFGDAEEYQLKLYKDPEPSVETPTAESPSDGEEVQGSSITLKSSDFSGTWGEEHVDSRFKLYDADTGDLLETYDDLGPVTETQVAASADSQPYQPRPYILTPKEGDKLADEATLTCTSYRVAHAQADEHDKTRWQLFEAGADPDSDDPIVDEETEDDLESYTVTGEYGEFQARVQQRGADRGWTDWSPLGPTFEIVDPEADTPTAQEPSDGEESWPEYPTLQASAYSSNVDEEPTASRYRLYDPDTGDVVYDSGEIEYTTSHAVPYDELPSDYKE